MSDRARAPYLRASVFAKLLAIMLGMTLVIVVAVGGFFGFVLRPGLGASIEAVLEEYARLVAASAPDLETARGIAARTGMDIRYEGKDASWATSDGLPSIAQARRPGLLSSDPHTPFGHEYYVAARPGGGAYLVAWAFSRSVSAAHDRLLGLLLLQLVVVILTAHVFLRRTLRPLRALHEGVAMLGRGDLDVTVGPRTRDELGDLTDAFNGMVGRVREMVRSRDQLLLDVSHELRSPLTRMKVALALAPGGDSQRRLVAEVVQMETMVGELLELERFRDGRGLRLERRDLVQLLRDAVDVVREHPPGARITSAPAEVVVAVDPAELRIVVSNLLDNALKYSLPDSRPVEVSVVETEAAVVVCVRDDGPGIPDQDLASIFEPFFRVDRSRSRKTGGYGLGLSICKRVVEAHGGSITAENNAGRGATFRVSLPKSS
jgi:signal transduction histidine kinase